MERPWWLPALLVPLGVFLASFFGAFVYDALILTPHAAAPASAATSSPSGAVAPAAGNALATPPPPVTSAPEPSAAPSDLVYTFNVPGILDEAASPAESTSPFWFLDSGGRLIMGGGVGETIQGALSAEDPWRKAYARTSATDTDGGRYPQNLFRLVTKQAWGDSREELSYRIVRDELTDSPNRNASNGLLLMSRYQSGATLYYAGIRVDGSAVIKKKYDGTYYTLAELPLFSGTYDRTSAPDLLPHGTWLRLRLDTVTEADGNVQLSLYLTDASQSAWLLIASATDVPGRYGGTPAITAPGRAGVRTDFMDVAFSDFRVHPL